MTTGQVAIRLPAELLEGIDALVPDPHPSRSDVIRRAIEQYLYDVACRRDAEVYEQIPLTDEELALGDDQRNWQATDSW